MTLFQSESYRELMAQALTGPANRGRLTRAAAALNCQRSYLSRVIQGEMHLTPDHAFGLTEFLRYDLEEQAYFILLVDWERAGTATHRRYLGEKLKELRLKHESVESQTGRSHLVQNVSNLRYFSSWIWSALHILTSIPRFQKLEVLAEHLGVSATFARKCLEELEAAGLVEKSKQGWLYKEGDVHLPKTSPLLPLHHQNWRARALLEAQIPEGKGIHYTGLQTLSRSDAQKIRELLLGFIRTSSRIAAPSKPEEALVMTLDLFSL